MSDLQNFTVKRGDTLVFTLTVTRGGVAVDITGSTIWFTAKKNIDDQDAVAIIQKKTGGLGIVLTTPASGIATITVASGDTVGLTKAQVLHYDVQLKESGGTISTVAEGELTVQLDVTQSTT